jgi:uncharacterized membrane protein (DUF2068 family)
VEAYGLWRERRWAEWLGCIGAAIYIPLEYRHFVEQPGLVSTVVLGTNVIIVAYLAACLWKGRKKGEKSDRTDGGDDFWDGNDSTDDLADGPDDGPAED